MRPTEAALMELDRVDVAYHGDIRILRGLSFKVRPGVITGVIGPNGAGKSTALKALYGLLKPVAGDILIDGRKVTGLPPWKFIDHGVALVPQQRSLFNELSVEDNLRLACWSFRRDRARVEEALERAYAQFPMLRDKRRDLAGSMSGGQQRFLELGAGAGAASPRAAARRADGDDRAAHQRGDLRIHPRTCRRRASPCCWSTRTCASACASPTTSTCWSSARTRSTARPAPSKRMPACAT